MIPSWNDAAMLSSCLAALAAQTRLADEIIVVDNASTDATADVARRAGARVVTEPVRGVLVASATGFDAATGDIIARLDADSVPSADWLENIERILAAAGTPAAVTGPAEFYGATRFIRWFGRHVYLGGYFWCMQRMLGHSPLFGSNLGMHAEVWAAVRDRTVRTTRWVHDDLYLSIRLPSTVAVIFDDDLGMAISARPFASPSAIVRRMHWGLNTLWDGWRRGGLWRNRTSFIASPSGGTGIVDGDDHQTRSRPATRHSSRDGQAPRVASTND